MVRWWHGKGLIRVAPLSPTKLPGGELRGSDVPPLYHAGRSVLSSTEAIEDGFFEGWYGWGFYMAFDPEFCRRWYGKRVTQFRVASDAKVLSASVEYSCAPPGLLDAIIDNDLKFTLNGNKAKAAELRKRLMVNPVQWVHGVDRLVIEQYDVVVYHDENVVLKVPEKVIIEGEVFPPEDD